jgi:hypothetical protein
MRASAVLAALHGEWSSESSGLNNTTVAIPVSCNDVHHTLNVHVKDGGRIHAVRSADAVAACFAHVSDVTLANTSAWLNNALAARCATSVLRKGLALPQAWSEGVVNPAGRVMRERGSASPSRSCNVCACTHSLH